MNVDVRCPACRSCFTVPTTVLGKRTKCTKCGERFELTAVTTSEDDLAGLDEIGNDFWNSSVGESAVPPPPIAQSSFDAGHESVSKSDVDSSVAASARSGKRQFSALRFVASFYELMSFIIAIVGVLAVVASVVLYASESTSIFQPSFSEWLIGTLIAIFCMSMIVTGLLFIAQLIRLALQVEENTFEAREACRRIAKSLESNSSR